MRSSYDERDYAFGQVIVTLRTHLKLTQAELAERLGVSRQAVGEWEAGSSYPKADHLKDFIDLGVQQHAFATGREVEEIRVLWQAARQKVLIDEVWLQEMLSTKPDPLPPTAESPPEQHRRESIHGPRVDWGDALDVSSFYGREHELEHLSQWVIEERCRMVSVLGIGGIGKSALTVKLMHQVAEHFQVVIWRSLRDAPSCESLLDECLQVLAPQILRNESLSLERRLSLLLECLRTTRVFLVFDNLETLLEEGQHTGHIRSGYEGYTQLLRRIAETGHQSCLFLTSREKPITLMALEGSRAAVRSLRLAQLDLDACTHLLAEKDVVGGNSERSQLIEAYTGNPLALKIVAQTIVEVFGGEIAPFLEQGEIIFGGIRELLREQYARLAELEQTLLRWLAIMREAVSLKELRAVLVTPISAGELLEALDGLLRRSLVEPGRDAGTFTLQSVVLEYVTAQLVSEGSREVEQGQLVLLLQHGLSQAGARDYVRQTQERLLLTPLLARLQHLPERHTTVEAHLCFLLDQLRTWAEQGYGPANLVMLLRVLRGNLRGLDLSQLSLRHLYLQDVEMQDASLAGATLQGSIFSEAFDGMSALAISRSGRYWAAGSERGDVWVWDEEGQVLHRMWRAHMDRIRTLSFSLDEQRLVTGSWDNSIKLWDVASGALLWSDWRASNLASAAFAPDGRFLATSGGKDGTIHLWDLQSGTCMQTLTQASPVGSIVWSPDGRLLASGDADGNIRLWEQPWIQAVPSVQSYAGHASWVMGLAFSPDGTLLASASWDTTVKLWEIPGGRLHLTLAEHTDQVNRVAWSNDGQTLVSCSRDRTIRVWDVAQERSRTVLLGHTADVFGLALTPDNRLLLSGSDDGTLRQWERTSGRCTRVMRGNVLSLFDIHWSPDGTQLVSGGTDGLITVWDVARGQTLKVLRGHRWSVSGVGWSPDGSVVASGGWDAAIRLWNLATETSLQIPEHIDDPDTIFFSLAWSPNGHYLACGTHASGVLVWDLATQTERWVGRQLPVGIRYVAWSPDSTRFVGTGEGNAVYIWDALDGTLLQQLPGHPGIATCIAWSADGTRIATGGRIQKQGSLFVWDVQSGTCIFAHENQGESISTLAWGASEDELISGDSKGQLSWWDIPSGTCMGVCEAHQGKVQALKRSPDGYRVASCGDDGAIMLWNVHTGEHVQTMRRDRPYERLNITGIRGLTEAQKETLHVFGAWEERPY
jgi:WD40 repeat protein/transcriptional regulator with XRE-family HTH domain